MNKYITLLRGINVSGQKKIIMSDLKGYYEELGFTNVKTYIQSGNVIFCTSIKDTREINTKIENKIKSIYNFSVYISILEVTKIKSIIVNNPFIRDGIDITKVAVVFMNSIPVKKYIIAVKEYNKDVEQFIISKDIIYLYCPNGFGKTKLSNNFFENKLKVKATTRNWKTTTKLLELATEINCE